MTRSPLLVTIICAAAFAALLALAAFSPAASAEKTTPAEETTDAAAAKDKTVSSENHTWAGYHWARQNNQNPFTLKVGDNVSTAWDSYLATTISDWSASDGSGVTLHPSPGNLTKVAGGTNPKNCRATNGRVEVCNSTYGRNGWLGLAGISITGGTHITQGYVKLNDTYYNTQQYNTPAWRNLVSCQEVGHTLGLDHQDETFDNANLDTCMDYTNDPSSNQHPNQGDYDELLCIYDPGTFGKTLATTTHSCTGTAHLDSTTTIGANTPSGKKASGDNPDDQGDGPPAWGKEVSRSSDGRESVFEKDNGNGEKKVTHVRWTEERAAQHRGGKKE
jgi:hypothetical protein